jgi:DNA polymerase lambda
MGIWKGPSSPCFRRIDLKFYPRSQLAYAVNYFASGQNFCRALRFWCNTPVPEVEAAARALNPRGNAFKLSDRELVVVNRAAPGFRWQVEQGFSTKAAGSRWGSRKRQKGGGVVAVGAGVMGTESDEDDEQQGGGGKGIRESVSGVLVPARQGGDRELVVGPNILCPDETTIFKTVGLSYVPPHMRNIMG